MLSNGVVPTRRTQGAAAVLPSLAGMLARLARSSEAFAFASPTASYGYKQQQDLTVTLFLPFAGCPTSVRRFRRPAVLTN